MRQGRSLRKVAKGGALFTGGSLGATALHFVTGITIIRLVERSEYGLIALGTTTVAILSVLSMLGFKTAVPRFLAQHRATGDTKVADEVAGTALACAVGLSGLFALLLHAQAPLVALAFHESVMGAVFEVLALMLPAMVLIETFSAIFQGLENARAKVMFQDMALNVLRLALLVPVALAGLGFQEVLWVYVASAWITLVMYLIYAVRALRGVVRPRLSWAVAKELLWFSFPLLGVSIMANVVAWTATLTLGYLQPAEELGRFSAPMRLAAIISVPLAGMNFLFLPVVSKLVARGAVQEVQELYRSTTKWAFLATLPLLMYLVADAEFVVTFLFGPAYHDAANVLRILVLGFAINAFTGPNGATLVAFGDTRSQFVLAMLAAVAAVLLCLLLVPGYGALGAALGMAIAKSIAHGLASVVLFRKFSIHPITSAYLKPVLLVTAVSLATGVLLNQLGPVHPLLHLLVLLGIAALTLWAPMLTRTLSHSDLDLIGSIERRIRGKTGLTEKLSKWVDKHSATHGSDA
jgi:O-antigen/teichoic acid export membrane protein